MGHSSHAENVSFPASANDRSLCARRGVPADNETQSKLQPGGCAFLKLVLAKRQTQTLKKE